MGPIKNRLTKNLTGEELDEVKQALLDYAIDCGCTAKELKADQ